VAHASYGSAESLAWLVHESGIEPHIPVFDKSARSDSRLSQSDFTCDTGTTDASAQETRS
jgi:hypothetical protein